jgi:hypothetical protein
VGGVRLNLESESDVRDAFSDLVQQVKAAKENVEIWGVLVQEMVRGGKETILGMKRDPQFGALLMFGLGGIYVEVLRDVTFRIAPIRELGAKNMIENIKGIKLLMGYRGEPPSDLDAIANRCCGCRSWLPIFRKSRNGYQPVDCAAGGSGARVVDGGY